MYNFLTNNKITIQVSMYYFISNTFISAEGSEYDDVQGEIAIVGTFLIFQEPIYPKIIMQNEYTSLVRDY